MKTGQKRFTLIKKLPLPVKKFIGDMTDTDRFFLGLDLRKTERIAGVKIK